MARIGRPTTPRINRLFSRISFTDDCWDWTGPFNPKGYGNFYETVNSVNTNRVAHRVVFEELFMDIPEGLTLDHLCRNKVCVNPDHLEPVTLAENINRANILRTHCKWGHEMTEDNIYIPPKRQNRKDCKKCRARRTRQFQDK